MLTTLVKCHECGEENDSAAEFCQKCGSVIYESRELPRVNYSDIFYLRGI